MKKRDPGRYIFDKKKYHFSFFYMYTALAGDMYTHTAAQQDIMRNKRKGENGLLSLLCRINIFHEPRSPSLISLWHLSLLTEKRNNNLALMSFLRVVLFLFFFFYYYLFLTRKVPHGRLREPAETTAERGHFSISSTRKMCKPIIHSAL